MHHYFNLPPIGVIQCAKTRLFFKSSFATTRLDNRGGFSYIWYFDIGYGPRFGSEADRVRHFEKKAERCKTVPYPKITHLS